MEACAHILSRPWSLVPGGAPVLVRILRGAGLTSGRATHPHAINIPAGRAAALSSRFRYITTRAPTLAMLLLRPHRTALLRFCPIHDSWRPALPTSSLNRVRVCRSRHWQHDGACLGIAWWHGPGTGHGRRFGGFGSRHRYTSTCSHHSSRRGKLPPTRPLPLIMCVERGTHNRIVLGQTRVGARWRKEEAQCNGINVYGPIERAEQDGI
jgi:hypothetical protein